MPSATSLRCVESTSRLIAPAKWWVAFSCFLLAAVLAAWLLGASDKPPFLGQRLTGRALGMVCGEVVRMVQVLEGVGGCAGLDLVI